MARLSAIKLKRATDRLRDESGATLVEFAFVVTLLFTVVILTIQGGLIFESWSTITNAAREGARYGAPCINRAVEGCTTDDVHDRVYKMTEGMLDQSAERFRVQVIPPGSANMITVTVHYTVPNFSPIPGLNDLRLSALSEMRTEVQE